jgi:RNA polymerase sigma-70 factor, ECF subfamily
MSTDTCAGSVLALGMPHPSDPGPKKKAMNSPLGVFSSGRTMTREANTSVAQITDAPTTSSTAAIIPLRQPLRKHELDERSDDELMQLASAGLDEALALLVRRYQHQVRSYCARRCASWATGDDVAQEVFVELWRGRARYEPRGRFRSYLFTIVQTRTLNAIQRRPREEELPPELPLPGDELDALLAAERSRRIQDKLGLLPSRLREAVLLRLCAGLDYDEIAQVLHRTPSAIRSRVFHGVMRLRQLLGKDGER